MNNEDPPDGGAGRIHDKNKIGNRTSKMENQKLPNPVDLILAPVKKPEVATIDKRKSQSTPRDKQYRGGKTKGI